MGRAPILIVGVGNLLARDDGVGVHAARLLAPTAIADRVEVCDAGTAGLGATGLVAGRDLVVVVDAIDAGEEPGAVFRLAPEEIRPMRGRTATPATVPAAMTVAVPPLGLHEAHILDALDEAGALGRAPRRVVFYVVQVADVSTGMDLSPLVEAALPRLVDLVLGEVGCQEEVWSSHAETS